MKMNSENVNFVAFFWIHDFRRFILCDSFLKDFVVISQIFRFEQYISIVRYIVANFLTGPECNILSLLFVYNKVAWNANTGRVSFAFHTILLVKIIACLKIKHFVSQERKQRKEKTGKKKKNISPFSKHVMFDFDFFFLNGIRFCYDCPILRMPNCSKSSIRSTVSKIVACR